MITNERQYRITKKQAEKFQQALHDFNEIDLIKGGIDPVIVVAQRASIEVQLNELKEALQRYEDLQAGEATTLTTTAVAALGEKFIESRIAKGLTQRELADRLGMKEQQIQRYEQERYLSASLERISEISQALQIDLDIRISLDRLAKNGTTLEFDPSRLPVKEMKRRGWFANIENQFELRSDSDFAAEYVSRAFRGPEPRALHKQTFRGKGADSSYPLLAWKARILEKARLLRDAGHYKYPDLDSQVVKQLANLSREGNGPVAAVELLRSRGVAVVFEEHFASTALDGAALLLDRRTPVIGLTLRHDRLDNFWFVLMHELGHIVCHRDGLSDGFFDDDSVESSEEVEREADSFAQNSLLPMESWSNSFVRFTNSDEEVVAFARKHSVSVAIVAGRIRRERNNYKLFSGLVGQGQVRTMLRDAGLSEI